MGPTEWEVYPNIGQSPQGSAGNRHFSKWVMGGGGGG